MKKLLTIMIMTLTLIAFGVATAEATDYTTINVTVTVTASALNVSIDTAAWGAGTLVEGASATTGTGGNFTATNDSSNVTVDFSIVAGSSTPSGWTAGATAGDEVFLMEAVGEDLSTLTSIDSSQTLKTGVAPTESATFDLKLTAPTATDHGGVQQTIPVTVTVTAS